MSPSQNRYTLIDYARAFAIVLMIIYHFLWDLVVFKYTDYQMFTSLWATIIGRTCLILFLIVCGYSLALAHQQKIHWKSFWWRWIKIAGAAAVVSIGSCIAYPTDWIYFGILHNIALSSLVGLVFLRIPFVALPLGLAMMITYYGWNLTLPWFRLDRASLDYIPFFPWFGSVLIGIGLYAFEPHKQLHPPHHTSIEWLSRHSLIIYLIHQPLLMGCLWLFTQVNMVL